MAAICSSYGHIHATSPGSPAAESPPCPLAVSPSTSRSASKALSVNNASNSLPLIKGAAPQTSCRRPGINLKSIRFPNPSAIAKILVVIPPLDLPIAWWRVPPLHLGRGLWLLCCRLSWRIPYRGRRSIVERFVGNGQLWPDGGSVVRCCSGYQIFQVNPAKGCRYGWSTKLLQQTGGYWRRYAYGRRLCLHTGVLFLPIGHRLVLVSRT